uniref:EF-hand domain-containing protein n=1 Tax=Panthera tigris altaica TaxID=74533 RepID=A0A8C9J5I0_PANTA
PAWPWHLSAAGVKAFPTSSTRSRSSCADENLLPMTPRQLAAFQEIFKLFSPSPTGTVDMRSMRAALRHVGIQLSPQEMCEALRQADLDGDGTVSFKDFLGVLTDSYRLAQCLGQARNSRFYDPQGLQTLFLEILFKLMSQGFVPHKSVQEVMSYYTKKQRALRPNPGWKDRWRDHSGSAGAPGGLTFFCQAARLSGLSSNELDGSWTPKKPGPGRRRSNPGSLGGVTKAGRKANPVSKGSCRLDPPHFVGQPADHVRPSKLAPSPPTLVQKQPSSPSPASLQKSAMKNVYK